MFADMRGSEAIGNTPLIRLNRVSEETGCDIYGKAEFMNPGGSVKGFSSLPAVFLCSLSCSAVLFGVRVADTVCGGE